eukprot:5613574-Pleurochrysis_carterae.AAC.1
MLESTVCDAEPSSIASERASRTKRGKSEDAGPLSPPCSSSETQGAMGLTPSRNARANSKCEVESRAVSSRSKESSADCIAFGCGDATEAVAETGSDAARPARARPLKATIAQQKRARRAAAQAYAAAHAVAAAELGAAAEEGTGAWAWRLGDQSA